MKRIIILMIAFIVSTSNGVQAQISTSRQERTGSTHVGPNQFIVSPATFAIGMSLDGGATFAETAHLGDSVVISGVIRPEASHIGQAADIVVVERSDDNLFTMRIPSGTYINWEGAIIANLIPFLEDQILTPELNVEIFTGQLGLAGGKRLFLGYIPADGRLRFNSLAARVDVTTQSARDEAVAMFASSISSKIVHTNCIVCHSSGGAADGLSMQKFVGTTNADHLNINFMQFENLVNAKGRDYILSKVQGGEGHVGGVVLIPGSVDYNNLATFLSLLENL